MGYYKTLQWQQRKNDIINKVDKIEAWFTISVNLIRADNILGDEMINMRDKEIICMEALEFINFTNYIVKKASVFFTKEQTLIMGLTCSSKNSDNMFSFSL